MFRGEISKWLLHDDQKELFEILFAATLNILFLALVALLLWPLGRPQLAFRLAKGYVVLWVNVYAAAVLVNRIQRFFGVNIDDHPDTYVVSNLAVSGFLQAGWSAFAALVVHSFAPGTPIWITLILYLVGVLSCLVAFFAVSSFYQGHIYKFVSLPLALISFIIFSVWPASGRVIYGWYFELF
jgi:hypothetical protein